MAPPPIQLFLTTIASQPALRQRQEYILRVLQVKKIPYSSYDLASDEEAKKLWRRKAPRDKQQLPGILVGGDYPGGFDDFEEAVECDDLDAFLRRNEDYKAFEDDAPPPAEKPIGVPGAYSPLQMHPKHQPVITPESSPLKGKGKPSPNELDAGETLGDAGLTGVNVTEEDLLKLVAELGLGGDDADDLVKGLTGDSESTKPKAEAEKELKGLGITEDKPTTPSE